MLTENMSDKPAPALTANTIVVHVHRRERRVENKDALPQRDIDACLDEAVALAQAINLRVVLSYTLTLQRPTAATLLGQGQVEALRQHCADHQATLVVVNHTLSPVQQRNLEKEINVKVIDRTGLILEIFGARANTREGRLQVELAALTYQQSRLVRSWTHLERQRGGHGFLGGPGETQLEIDRRLIGGQILKIKADLDAVRRTRSLQREARKRREQPLVALVGYTNAGKSTLFNALTAADVLAKDMLFATLDPVMRLLTVAPGRTVVLSDTVGFIADLPTHLVEAFKATLEEVENADVILHVRDVAHADTEAQRRDVMNVLESMGIHADDPRLVEVLNKTDLLEPAPAQMMQAQTAYRRAQGESVLALSALTGAGLDTLQQVIEQKAFDGEVVETINLSYESGAALAWLHAHAKINHRTENEQGMVLTVAISPATLARYHGLFPAQTEHGDSGKT